MGKCAVNVQIFNRSELHIPNNRAPSLKYQNQPIIVVKPQKDDRQIPIMADL
jgi:hypothetical protein